MRKKIKNFLKRSICCICLVGTLLNSFSVVHATENETEASTSATTDTTTDSSTSDTITSNLEGASGLTNLFIRMSAGKNMVQDTEAFSNLTNEDLRFVGVFLSNYFIPFGTEFGTSKSEITEQNKKDMKQALQTNLNFSDNVADEFVEKILGLSRSNNKELVLCVSEEYQSNLVEVKGIDLSYYVAFTALSGRLCDMASNIVKNADTDLIKKLAKQSGDAGGSETPETNEDGDTVGSNSTLDLDGDMLTELVKGSNNKNEISMEMVATLNAFHDADVLNQDCKYKYVYFAYDDGSGNYVPVFDAYLKGDNITPSAAAFFKCLESVDFEKGFGTNLLDYSKADIDSVSDSEIEKLKELLGDSVEYYKQSVYYTRLRVDCMGNLLVMGTNHQFIMVPACMNPYVWKEVDESGNDTATPAGSQYMLINIPSLAMQDSDGLFKSVSGSGSSRKGELKTSNLADRLVNEYWKKSISTDTSELILRLMRGDSRTDLRKGKFGPIPNLFKTEAFTFITQLYDGLEKYDKYNYAVYALHDAFLDKSDHIYVLAPIITKKKGGVLSMAKDKKIALFDNMAFVDDLGAFGYNNSQADLKWDGDSIKTAAYIGDESSGLKDFKKAYVNNNGFANRFNDIKDGNMQIVEGKKEATVSVFITYCYAGAYEESNKEKTIGKLGYRMFFDSLPEASNSPLNIESATGEDVMANSIKQWLYYLLHPTKGLDYVRILLTNKLNSFLLGWHNDMLGTKGVGAITGTTKYRSNFGYLTTPDLSEIEWTASLIDVYRTAIPYVAIFMLIVFVFIFIVGILSLQRCFLGFIIFCVFLLLPIPFINGVVGTSNSVISRIYGEKFTYWALVQHESYSSLIDEAANGDSYENYLRTIYATNQAVNPNQGGETVVLKWQAPKKMASLMLSFGETSLLKDFAKTFISGAIENAYSHETYIDDSDVTYLYRSYLDISNFSRYIYRGIKNGDVKSYNQINTSGLGPTLEATFKGMTSDYSQDRKNGYSNKDKSGNSEASSKVYAIVPFTSKIVNDAFSQAGSVANLTIDDYVGIHQDFFNFSLPMFNSENNIKIIDYLTGQAKDGNFKDVIAGVTEEDITGLAGYSLYSESVFYYFSWLLYDCGLEPDATTTGGYKNLLLGEDNAGFFYNAIGNGELKDFMDMKTLFTYVIPYLNRANKVVLKWDDVYGTRVYEGVSTDEGQEDNYKSNPELKQKYWNNLNVARLYNLWCPWVGLMYDCSYAKSETIEVMGSKFVVDDPIDPSSYPAERPMIFSRSEMADYGLTENDLTKVERLILKCNDEMEESLFELLNYHNFNDVVLDTAAAMNCAFIFNKNFSETSLFGNNIEIYPQSFELQDFSYDAFLRFILAESTGESITNNKDFYYTIVTNSSMTSVIAMIILDIIAMYLLPGLKIAFLILVFLSAILVILMSVFRIDTERHFVSRMFSALIKPMILFLLISLSMSYIISMFMGTGSNSVTGTNTGTISFGDPAMVLIFMMVLNIVFLILYFKVLRSIWASVVTMGRSVGGFGMGVVTAIASGGLLAAVGASRSTSSGGYSGSPAVNPSSSGGEGSVPSGGENPRATSRSTNYTTIVNKEEEPHSKENQSRGRTSYYDKGNSLDNLDKDKGVSDSYKKDRSRSIDQTSKDGMDKIRLRNKANRQVKRDATKRGRTEGRAEARAYRKSYSKEYNKMQRDRERIDRESSERGIREASRRGETEGGAYREAYSREYKNREKEKENK